jgi:hypothetical protein
MKSFKGFYLTEAFNVGINSSDDADIQKLVSYLQGLSTGKSKEIVMVAKGGDKPTYKIKRDFVSYKGDIENFVKDNNLSIPFAPSKFGNGSVGEGGKKVPGEVQEMMTACLVLLKYKGGSSITEEEAIELIEKSKEIYSKVDGADRRPDFLDFFQGNFNDLGTAISAANYILNEVGTASKIYWTGKGWHKDIQKFNPKLGRIKDYNSSDIVVKSSSGKFYGYSLKKKGSVKSPDPTLINKPITGKESVLQDIVGADTILIENAKRIFFERVLMDKLKLSKQDVRKMKPREYTKAINKIPVETWGVELKKPTNIFFKKVFNVIKSHDKDFVEKFLELVFRTKLDDTLNAAEFQFTLLTGIGRFVRGKVEVEKADAQELSNIVTALQDLYNSKLEVRKTSGKVGAWEKNAGAAKVFLTIYSDGSPILDIEVRYKGSYSANPQFQAMATADFKKIFKK